MSVDCRHGAPLPVIELFRSERVMAATTFRGEGASEGDPYSGFSLCHYCGDTEAHYLHCRERLAGGMGIGTGCLVIPRQIHGSRVAVVDSLPVEEDGPDGIDAAVTTLRGVAVGVNTADCVPVLLFDEENGVAGAAHAGWRGAVGGVLGETVRAMRALGAGHITGVLGPCICRDCFEVGEEVASRFPDRFVTRQPGCRPHVDLPAFVISVLEGLGVKMLPFGDECTRCKPQRYFSARALGRESGRNYSFVMLR